jgi:hypothetical protein
VDDAVERIGFFYHRYHSIRYVQGRLVIRLASPIGTACAQMLREQFSDILVPEGEMVLSGPLPAEADEPEIAHLPRLVVDFDRRSFGKLRSLIDAINRC